VTFSKTMKDGSWSWVMEGKDTFPELAGDPFYQQDGRTDVVKLRPEPGRTYVIWLNSDKFHNFKDHGGRPAVPYLLAFETKQ